VAKRLQVILDDPEYREIQRMARASHMTLAEWVRRALAAARRREPVVEASRKISAVRNGARHSFPSGDIGEMLAQIERGYTSDPGP
jgi:hypothetical protein